MNSVYLCLGGNLGDREKNMNAASAFLEKELGRIAAQSRIYESEPWGSSSAQWYLNRVILLHTAKSPEETLLITQEAERNAGRQRRDSRNADRTLDIDLLFFDSLILRTAELEIPHPRLHLRKFALVPMQEIEPSFMHPVFGATVSRLLSECADTCIVRRYEK
jgi:2-amino-4-hydroxy-6-hydroxymethyldihydropteridine diphosphokinase